MTVKETIAKLKEDYSSFGEIVIITNNDTKNVLFWGKMELWDNQNTVGGSSMKKFTEKRTVESIRIFNDMKSVKGVITIE